MLEWETLEPQAEAIRNAVKETLAHLYPRLEELALVLKPVCNSPANPLVDDRPEKPIADPDEVASFYVLNTNYSNDPIDHEDMLQKKKAAAYFDPWKFKIENLSKGDTVFLYQSGVGLVALGQASGKLEKAAYHGDPTKQDEEYFMALEQFQRIEPPLSAAKIKEVTGKNHVFLQTMFSLDPDSASALIRFIQHRE